MDSSLHNSSFQLADTQSISTPTDDRHPLPITPAPNTPAQHIEAAAVLKNEDDGDIFAWLKLARSLERHPPYRTDHAGLTRDQVRAIAALRHSKNNDIITWLRQARTSSM